MKPFPHAPRLLLALSVLVLWPALAMAQSSWQIDEDKSVFAIVIHKAGIGAALAHNHLVVAEGYEAELEATAGESASIAFDFKVAAENLVFDDAALQEKWYPAIEEAGLLDEPLSEKSADTRQKIRKSALGEGQLDADEYPEITAAVTGVSSAEDGGHVADLRFTVHGQQVDRSVPVKIQWDGDRLIARATPSFRFTEFGIEPYSAFLGAIKNKDTFDLFVHVEASPADNS